MATNESKLQVLSLDFSNSQVTSEEMQAIYKLKSLKDLTIEKFQNNIDEFLMGLCTCCDLVNLAFQGELQICVLFG